jgi:GAF domain-containing protein
MRSYSVTARGLSSVQVTGRNWIVALGHGLAELGRDVDLTRLACEVLPNGTVIARDIRSGTGFVVQAIDEAVDELAADDADNDVFELGASPDETDDVAELPADAIHELDPHESQRFAIDAAETVALACQLALQSALARVPAESGAVILEEKGHMRFFAVAGPHSRKLMGVRLPMGTGVAGFALEKGRTIIVTDAHEDARHCGEVDALTGYQTRAIAVVPIRSGERLFGVLELMNLPEGQRFHDDEVAAMTDLADALARRLAE